MAQPIVQHDAVLLSAAGKCFRVHRSPAARLSARPEALWALKGITLNVKEGSVTGIIGRNGAGKTTLMNIIAGVMQPDEGSISSSGKVIGLFNLGVGFQDELSGRDNIYLNGAILGAGRKELDERIADILAFSELGEFIDMPLGSYSQGMRLRLGFSIITNLDFDVLVLDEVLAVGDVLFQDKCFKRLMDLKHVGKTLVISTQDLALVERLCDSAALLDHGEMLFCGAPAEAVNRYRALLSSERFYVGPVPKTKTLVENTKKWADDISLWGTRRGTKEAVIDRVQFLNRWGFSVSKISSGSPLTVRVDFRAEKDLHDPHFGIAFFRDDGVYCYGPNTKFDGYRIPLVPAGKGSFMLLIPRFWLAAGAYKVSVAIWDRDEALAYDYHEGCYSIAVAGAMDPDRPLFYSPCTFTSLTAREGSHRPITMLDGRGICSDLFYTNNPLAILVRHEGLVFNYEPIISIMRDDGICCQKIALCMRDKHLRVYFPRLMLLPGRYELRCGSARCGFRVVSDRFDHGTVYMEHSWAWRIQRNGSA